MMKKMILKWMTLLMMKENLKKKSLNISEKYLDMIAIGEKINYNFDIALYRQSKMCM